MNLIIDFDNMFARAYYAVEQEHEIHAVFKFANMLMNINSHYNKPEFSHIAVDSGEYMKRAIYQEYKANRPDKPEDWNDQKDAVKIMLREAGFPLYESYGYEADDIINSLVKKIEGDIVILSSDKDLVALCDDRVYIQQPNKNKALEPQDVIELYGVNPEQIPDYLALVGDAVDNIPGVYGIGPANASKLISEYGTLANLYHYVESGKINASKAVIGKLKKGHDQALQSKLLVELFSPNVEPVFNKVTNDQIRSAVEHVKSLYSTNK